MERPRPRSGLSTSPGSVSVVVPVHNGAATLDGQLGALAREAERTPCEVVVVDNRSTDSTARVARAWHRRLPGLRLVSATGGSGVAYARNAGTRVARGEYVLYCDADDEVRPGWVRALAEALGEAAIAGGVLDVTRINDERIRSLSWPPESGDLPTTMRYLPYAAGACMGVRRSVWAELGGFEEGFVGGHEEVDFAWRAQRLGHQVAFAPGAVVDYRLRTTVAQVARQRFGYGRSYAQLYGRFRDAPVRRASARHEVKVVGGFLLSAPGEFRSGRGALWAAGAAWTLGRWRGNLDHRVRSPL